MRRQFSPYGYGYAPYGFPGTGFGYEEDDIIFSPGYGFGSPYYGGYGGHGDFDDFDYGDDDLNKAALLLPFLLIPLLTD